MKPDQFLLKLIHFLNEMGLEYVLTGSLAAAGIYGRPRIAKDFDLMVGEPMPLLSTVQEWFPPNEFVIWQQQVNLGVFRQASIYITEKGLGWRAELFFNIPEHAHGVTSKRKRSNSWRTRNREIGRALVQSSFERRRRLPLGDEQIWVIAPEEILLIKLSLCRYHYLFRDKDWQDALAVFRMQAGQLDLNYLNHAMEQFGLNPYWEQIQQQGQNA